MEKRNAQRGDAFGDALLTWKTRDCPLRIARKNVIGVVLGCLGGGDNPTIRGGFGAAAKCGKRVFIGVSGGFDLVYMGVSVCATRVRGALRVARGVRCGVSWDAPWDAPAHHPALAIEAVLARAAFFSCSMVSCLTCS